MKLSGGIKVDEKTIRKELEELASYVEESLHHISVLIAELVMQENKKAIEMVEQDTCNMKALYATRKYGCAGIQNEIMCEVCPFKK